MKTLIIIFLILLSFTTYGQDIEAIINNIEEINIYHSELRKSLGVRHDNYLNYELLRDNATTQKLIELVYHSNPVVSCYAGLALIEKDYTELDRIFLYYLDSRTSVPTGTQRSDPVSNIFYYAYIQDVTDKKSDIQLFKIDSIIIYHQNSFWSLYKRALENRVYPVSFNDQISDLAFNSDYTLNIANRYAVFYLSNWYRAEYAKEIKIVLVNYLEQDNIKDNGGTAQYYEVVSELIKFNDEEIKQIVSKKLISDTSWTFRTFKERFKLLIEENNLFQYQYDLRRLIN